MVSSGMVGRGLRLRIPDVSPASSEVAASTVVFEVLEWRLAVVSVLVVSVTSLLRCHPDISLAIFLPGF